MMHKEREVSWNFQLGNVLLQSSISRAHIEPYIRSPYYELFQKYRDHWVHDEMDFFCFVCFVVGTPVPLHCVQLHFSYIVNELYKFQSNSKVKQVKAGVNGSKTVH